MELLIPGFQILPLKSTFATDPDKLPPGVLEELRRKNPLVRPGRRKYKHHQLLTEQLGNVHLEKHLASVITLMRISPTWPDFERFMMKAFPDRTIPSTLELPFKDTTPI